MSSPTQVTQEALQRSAQAAIEAVQRGHQALFKSIVDTMMRMVMDQKVKSANLNVSEGTMNLDGKPVLSTAMSTKLGDTTGEVNKIIKDLDSQGEHKQDILDAINESKGNIKKEIIQGAESIYSPKQAQAVEAESDHLLGPRLSSEE